MSTEVNMAVSKIKIFSNGTKLKPFLCHMNSYFKKAQLRNFISSRYCSSESNSSPTAPCEIDIKKNLQPIPKKDRKLSVIDEQDKPLIARLKGGDKTYPYESEFDKAKSVFIDNMQVAGSLIVKHTSGIKLSPLEKPFYPRQSDIVIIGSNAIGLSIAYALKEKCRETPSILIIDKNENFPKASTNIGQSMLTQQFFTDEEEIEINKYAVEFLSTFPRLTAIESLPRFKVSYEPMGSLILVDETNAEKVLRNNELLKKHDIYNKILDIKTLKRKFPWLNLSNVLFGSLGMTYEGMYDPWLFLVGLKSKVINLGVKFLTAEVLEFGTNNFQALRRVICKLPNGVYHPVECGTCIVACGIESLNLVDLLNKADLGPLTIKLPLEERMKYEYCFHNPKGPELNTPLVIESDGTYFRREGLCNHYVAGVSNVPYGEENVIEPYEVFVNRIKPFLAKRVPQFNELELIKGWIDSYDFCISNEVGIIGPHPCEYDLKFALGFSHLGLQYAPAIGRAMMEHFLYDEYQTIDLSRYHIENLWAKQHKRAERKQLEKIESEERIAITD